MNIKKYSLKTMCAALVCTTVVSSMFAAYATDVIINETPMDDSTEIEASDSGWTTEESNLENIAVTYQQSSSYFVTIPKTIALGTNKQAAYAVKVTGEIDTKQRVYVAPVDEITETGDLDFYMKEKDNKKDDVVATVIQNKTYWSSEDVANAYEETNNSISAPGLTAGTWEGTFQMEIRLETEKEHEHNYIDGKCECGAIDPNHEHNYEDGRCTICGKETDPYEIAPENEYSKWNYTLDDENDIITLNYYKESGSVIVYANYVVNGKTYKTQIKSNADNATETTRYMFNGRPTSTSNCRYISSIIFSEDIDTSNVTNMSYMFDDCIDLTSIEGISNFDTSNVTKMNHMFYCCNKLASLDVSNFVTDNVTDMSYMFYGCNKLQGLDVSGFDTSKVTDMNYMFNACDSVTELDVSNFDTSKVTNMGSMFRGCDALTNIDLSSFNTSNVTNMEQMFYGLTVTSLDVSSFDTSNVTDMSCMFQRCEKLTSLDLSSFDTHKVTNMFQMFAYCTKLKSIYVTEGKWSTSQANTASRFTDCGVSEVTYK